MLHLGCDCADIPLEGLALKVLPKLFARLNVAKVAKVFRIMEIKIKIQVKVKYHGEFLNALFLRQTVMVVQSVRIQNTS